MANVLEHPAPVKATPRQAKDIQAEEIARDLVLMDEMEAFVRFLPPRIEGRNPTTSEIRKVAH